MFTYPMALMRLGKTLLTWPFTTTLYLQTFLCQKSIFTSRSQLTFSWKINTVVIKWTTRFQNSNTCTTFFSPHQKWPQARYGVHIRRCMVCWHQRHVSRGKPGIERRRRGRQLQLQTQCKFNTLYIILIENEDVLHNFSEKEYKT